MKRAGTMGSVRHLRTWVLLCSVGAACSNAPTSESPRCVPGQVVDCPCPGGAPRGVQTCNASATFEACQCGVVDAGAVEGVDRPTVADTAPAEDVPRTVDVARDIVSLDDLGAAVDGAAGLDATSADGAGADVADEPAGSDVALAIVDAPTSDSPSDAARDAGGPDVVGGCSPGATRACYTGSASSRGVGQCRDGVETCGASGYWVPGCVGVVLPAMEVCNGNDDDCNGVLDDDAAATASCPGAPNGRAACTSGACRINCVAGYHSCGGVCVSSAAVASCGNQCSPCSAPAHGSPTCASSLCGFSCDSGYHACGSFCVGNASTLTCGSRCAPCVAPPHATATCDGTSCGFTCDPGLIATASGCDVLAPRPVAPLTASTVTTNRPTLRWALASGSDGAHVEVCRDRACSTIERSFDASGGAGSLAVALPAGVHFWRIYGRNGATTGTSVSPTWEFFVPAHTTAVDSSSGAAGDFNGDGIADLALVLQDQRVLVYNGSVAGVASTPSTTLTLTGFLGTARPSVIGDVNGDGFVDLVVTSSTAAFLYWGGSTGLSASAAVALASRTVVLRAGDFNGDGYADALTLTTTGSPDVILFGGVTGLVAAPVRRLDAPLSRGTSVPVGNDAVGAGDVDGDGYSDVAALRNQELGSWPYFRADLCVFHGSERGPTTTSCSVPIHDGLLYTADLVTSEGDFDGDGRTDIVMTGNRAELPRSRIVEVISGASTTDTLDLAVIQAPATERGAFGSVLESGRDLNGDGLADLVLGSPDTPDPALASVYVLLGGRSGSSLTADYTLVTPLDDLTSGSFGGALGAADLNGDGRSDIIIGAPNADGRHGRFYVFYMAPSGPGANPSLTLTPPAGASFVGIVR